MTVVRDKPKPRPNLGAVKCWCSPPGAWSYITGASGVILLVEDFWAGGWHPVTRAIPPAKILERMTAAEIRAAKKAGRITDTKDGTGFFLSSLGDSPNG